MDLGGGRILYFMDGTAAIYRPAADSLEPVDWSVRPDFAFRLADGRVIGFDVQDGGSMQMSLFDPRNATATDQVRITAAHPQPVAALSDGRVLLASTRRAELFDPDDLTFQAVDLPPALGRPDVVEALPDGRVLLVSNGDGDPDIQYVFDPRTGASERLGPLLTSRTGATYTVLRDGRIVVSGGGLADGAEDPAAWLTSIEVAEPVP